MPAALSFFDESETSRVFDAAELPELPSVTVQSSRTPPSTLVTATPIPDSPHPLIFDHAAHGYTHAGRKMKGVSSLISLFKRPFDSAYWSKYKADKANVPQQQILDQWAAKRDAACDLGHAVHEFAESVSVIRDDQICEVAKACEVEGYCSGVINAYRDLQITPIEAEKPVCDPSIGIAGTIDLVCHVFGAPAIVDWKTNATINMANSYGDTMLPPLSHLDDCSFNHYSLQLNLYRFILARRYDFHAERLCLVWLPGDSTYQLIDVPILETEVAVMLSAWQRNGGQ